MAADEHIPNFSQMFAARAKTRTPARKISATTAGPQLSFNLPLAAEPLLVTPALDPAPPAKPSLYTVRQLIAEVCRQMEGAFAAPVNVEGEVSNCRPATSGHLYFTLKDGDAQLPVVIFRRQAMLLGFQLKDGMAVEARGRISVYESRGQLQLIAETLRPRGEGALQLAFEQLKRKLRAEGLFDRERTPLPAFPHCIGIVTSPHGAALRDIIHIVRRRHARLNILIYPALMQGVQSPRQVAAGIRWFNLHPERVDLIIVARGGGSLEDLAGFNDEALARVIAGSTLPVVAAIGHETDNTIADYVADLRAPTPSAAAELVTAAQHRIEERVAALERRVYRAGSFHLLRAQQRLQRLSAEYVLTRVRDSISLREQRLDDLRASTLAAVARDLRMRSLRVEALQARLRKHDPALRLALAQRRHSAATFALRRVSHAIVQARRLKLDSALLHLTALSPLAVLNRGYAIVYLESGDVAPVLLRDAEQAIPNQQIRARLARGSVRATITESAKS